MANRGNRSGTMPGWMKAGLGGAALLVLIALVMVAFGHNPLQHLGGHLGMGG
ncbi:MAG TPA: hypothetical protein VHZ56_13830 [Devosia sp.]|jgi:hypothetical protein|nr:hypothetical protein [Devosia sp.]